MTVQDVDNAFRKKSDASVKLFGLRKKIENGTATMEDAAQYQAMLSKILGQTVGENILKIPESERVKFLDWILRNQYQDANDRFAVIQQFLDKQQGIHIAPQKAPYPAERVEKLGKSLTDPTVPESTIQRRARAGTETVAKSFHDDYVKANTKFRSRAGLKCYITRKAVSGCCAWCTAMAGRYEYGEEPDDVYRRHDNCDCTVTFENGRQRQDVWSKRTWEAPKEDAGAGEPVRLTAEQTAKLQEKHDLKRLTNGRKGGIIESREVKPMIRAIEQPIEQQHTGKGNPNAILTFDVELNNRQAQLLEQLPDFDSRVTVPKNSVNMSDLSALTAKTGQEFAMFTKGQERLIIRGDTNSVNIDIDTARQLAAAGYRWSGHTHPGDSIQSMIASGGDMLVLEQFPQSTSVIYNSKGQYATFGKEE